MSIEVDVTRRLGASHMQVSFQAGAGVTALFGPSGAGKTSVMHMLMGLLRPERGRVALNGRVVFDSERGINVAVHKRRIGCIFQESRLFPHLSVRRNLLYGQRLTPVSERWARLDHVVAMLGIGHLLRRRPAGLSGGERQRVAIGRALLTSPSLLLMDEPLASLDAERKEEILPYIARLRDELAVPIVHVSHQFDEVKRLADELVLLQQGRVVDAGTLNDVLARMDSTTPAGRRQLGVLIDTRVVRHERDAGLTHLRCAAGDLMVPLLDRALEAPARIHIHAADVVLATERPHGLSIRNVLAATVSAIEPDTAARCVCRLDAGGIPLLAHITTLARRELGLHAGQQVFALFKSVAVDGEA